MNPKFNLRIKITEKNLVSQKHNLFIIQHKLKKNVIIMIQQLYFTKTKALSQ